MQIQDNAHSYGWVSQAFHWGMFALIIGLFMVANQMIDAPKGPDKFTLYGLHKSFGLTVLFLLFGRISWRLANPTPQDAEASVLEVTASRALHFLLYGVLLAMPVSGIFMTLAGGHPVSWFGLIDLPNLIGENKSLSETAKLVHQFTAYGTIFLIAGHVGAGLWHQFVRKDGIMKRMLPALAGK